MKKLITAFVLSILTLASCSQVTENSIKYSQGILKDGKCKVRYYCEGQSTFTFEVINKVVIESDTTEEFTFLQKAFTSNDSLFLLLNNIYTLVKAGNNIVVRPLVTGNINIYDNFYNSHTVLYPVIEDTASMFISLYKNYCIRSTEVKLLTDILDAYSLNGFLIANKDTTLYTEAMRVYNDYVAVVNSKEYWQ
jgi:hypothetical protein